MLRKSDLRLGSKIQVTSPKSFRNSSGRVRQDFNLSFGKSDVIKHLWLVVKIRQIVPDTGQHFCGFPAADRVPCQMRSTS